MQNRITWILFLLAFILCGCKKEESTAPFDPLPNYKLDDAGSSGIKICVYLDNGVFDVCKTYTVQMLNEMKCNYTPVNRDSILHGALNHYNLLLMPGGDMWAYASYLQNSGMTKIKDYVKQGGGYIGICGGAYFAANLIIWRGWANQPREYSSILGLTLFSATADGPIEDFAPTYVDSKCQIAIVQKENPIASNLPDIIEPYYDHGPKFLFIDTLNISTIGRTVNGNKRIIVSFRCGLGKVFLTGAHPERDDSHVSWIMVKNAFKWCSN
jgi:glutamine amidotransferase-like uncharacterized protein